jgi:amino acid adenylation domain-containing protein
MTHDVDLSRLSGDEKRALLAELLKTQAGAEVQDSPLSHGQGALWFLYQLAPDSSAYNISVSVRVRSRVNVAALRKACAALLHRHASLRGSFAVDAGQPTQKTRAYVELPFETVDASGMSEDDLKAAALEHHRRPFDLAVPPLCRVSLFTHGPSDHVLLVTTHHIAADGWSFGILLEELQALYKEQATGTPAQLAAPAAGYRDFVEWQSRRLAGEDGAGLQAYWMSQLSGSLPVLELPTDRPRPAFQTFRGDSCYFAVDPEVAEGLASLAKTEQTTLFSLLIAAYYVLLHRYTGHEDLIVGTPATGRTAAEFERVVGYFANPISLRIRLESDPTFREFLRQVKQVVQGGVAHQDYPFPLLIEQLRPPRDPSRSPVFQAMFNLMRARWLWAGQVRMSQAEDSSADELVLEAYQMPQEEGQFDLALDVLEADGRLGGILRYNSDLFDAATAERMARQFTTLLRSLVRTPEARVSELDLVDGDERSRVLAAWTDTARSYPDDTAYELFEQQAARTPDAIAVSDSNRTLTYAALNARANQLAHYLRAKGAGVGVLVGIGMERSTDLEVAVLAVMKSGAAYVPLDPAYPPPRLAHMIADAPVPLLLTTASLLDLWSSVGPSCETICMDRDANAIAFSNEENLTASARAGDIAYVIYTSGSTGTPKGVEIPHRALSNFLQSMRETPGMESGDVLVAVTTLSFDIAGLELLLPLAVGGRAVIATREQGGDADALATLLDSTGATMMQATPATWRLLVAAGWRGKADLKILCGGEALPQELADELLPRCASLWNMYGPTETTIWSACERVTPGGPITLGRPIANTQIYLLDRHRHLELLIGVPGEVYIGGDGVARGYRNRPDLTAERFVPDPFAASTGARLYRTGDLARALPDGRLAFLGRVDHQVKVRGHRIELGEIEAVLERHEAVRQAVATVHEDASSDRRLVAYIVSEEGEDVTSSDLRRFARAHLPDYMVPSFFVSMDALPLTPNAKVDRRALPAPFAQQTRQGERVEPRTPMERLVADVWKDVLHIADVSVHDNFFDVGGHSLVSVQVVARIEAQTGVRINPARLVLDTLEQISAACEQAPRQGAEGSAGTVPPMTTASPAGRA